MEGILRVPQGVHAVLHRGQGCGVWGGAGWLGGGAGWLGGGVVWLLGGGGWVQLLSGATWLGLSGVWGGVRVSKERRIAHRF